MARNSLDLLNVIFNQKGSLTSEDICRFFHQCFGSNLLNIKYVLRRRLTQYRYREIVENLIVLLDRVQKHASKSCTAETEDKEYPSPEPPGKVTSGKNLRTFKKTFHPLRQALIVNPITISPEILKFAKPRQVRPLSAPGNLSETPPPLPTSIPSKPPSFSKKASTKKREKDGSVLSTPREVHRGSPVVQTALSKPTLPRQMSDALDSRVF